MPILLRKHAGKYLRDKGIDISDHHLYTLLRSGKIPSYMVGNRYLVSTDAVEEYIKNEMQHSIIQNDYSSKIRAVK